MDKGEIKIYKSKNGISEIQVRLENDTVWLSQGDMQLLFGRDQSVISRHVNNVFKENELEKESNMQKMHIANSDKPVVFYSLDVIISVGYRVKSREGTSFRIWATSVLKNYLINGYALNQKRLQEKGYKELENTLALVKKAIGSSDISKDEALGLLEIITKYTNTWLLLQKYDEDDLLSEGKTKEVNYKLEAKEAYDSILELKKDLIKKGQATELFANLRQESGLEGIFGNIYQTFDGENLYPSTEEKAANLLYFVVKDHPFSDGNKRSGAFLFILFLVKNKLLFDKYGEKKINDRALVAITLLIAESNPKDKDIMVKLVMNLIN